MGNQKLKWTAEEEDALLAGIAKHGPGKWKNILKDPDFASALVNRSNIDLKDKWRNINVGNLAQGSKDKIRVPKLKAIQAAVPISVVPNPALAQNAASAQNPVSTVKDDSSKGVIDPRNASGWTEIIYEALSAAKDSNGSDLGAIFNYIEQRKQVPQNFRRLLGSKLRRLADNGKLDKVGSCYMIKKDTALGVNTPIPKQKDVRPQYSKNSGFMNSVETVEDASIIAAYKVVEAENKSFIAAEAVREAERVSKMAEDADSTLQLVTDIFEKCSRGEIVFLS